MVERSAELTYTSYLQLDELLSLQRAHSDPPEHDEMLFIVIHQVYELWFKQMLHEVEKVNRDFSAGRLYRAVSTLKRVRMILKTLVGQLDILETMTPLSFASFRDRLQRASGFQSVQFREVEFALGYKRPEMLKYHPEGSLAAQRLTARLDAPSLVDHFYDLLERLDVTIPGRLREKDVREATVASDELQEAILDLYRTRPDAAMLFELMMDIDEGFQEWRYRHVKVVERTIGNKEGTGGSLGVAFLKKSLFQPLFPDLWAVRHRL